MGVAGNCRKERIGGLENLARFRPVRRAFDVPAKVAVGIAIIQINRAKEA
jgi:hypothetical protein